MNRSKDDTERRILIAVLLWMVIYTGWSFFSPPVAPPLNEPEAGQVGGEQASVVGGSTMARVDPPLVGEVPPLPAVEALTPWEMPFAAPGVAATLSSEGASLSAVTLTEYPARLDVTPIWTYGLRLLGGASEPWRPYGDEPGQEVLLKPGDALFLAGLSSGSGSNIDDAVARYQRHVDATAGGVRQSGPVQVSIGYEPGESAGQVKLNVAFFNTSSAVWSGQAVVGSAAVLKDGDPSRDDVLRPLMLVDGGLEMLYDLSDLSQTREYFEGDIDWWGIGDRYFIAALIPEREWNRGFFAPMKDGRVGVFVERDLTIQPNETQAFTFEAYLGSKHLSSLQAVGRDLESSVDLGFFGFFARILLYILGLFHGLVGNWGVSIILLTVLVKTLFWPLTRRSVLSSHQMQALQPKLNALKEQFGDDSQGFAQAQMKLFQESGVNPFSGCLPVLIQMPIWFALYTALLYSADLYHADFLYIQDLSSMDPWGVLPTLVGALMILQQFLTPLSPQMDATQRLLIRAMPVVFAVFMYTFPAGLALYISVNTVLSIVQMWLVRRTLPDITTAGLMI